MSETRLVKTKSQNTLTDLVFVSLVIILGLTIQMDFDHHQQNPI